MTRPSWNEYFKEIVLATAKRSPCERLQVGCLQVLDKRIVSQGYNGFLPGCPHKSIVRDDHEEAMRNKMPFVIAQNVVYPAMVPQPTLRITHV